MPTLLALALVFGLVVFVVVVVVFVIVVFVIAVAMMTMTMTMWSPLVDEVQRLVPDPCRGLVQAPVRAHLALAFHAVWAEREQRVHFAYQPIVVQQQ